jgi:Protein of unknown function (DUF1648)
VNSRLKPALASLWFFLPLVAFRNWQVWDRLPARLGVHFDLAGRANGWMSRESGLGWVLILMAVILGAATLVRSHLFPPTSSPRAVLGVFYLALGAIYCGQEWIHAYNLNPDPTRLHVLPLAKGSLVAILALPLMFLGTGPSAEFPTGGRPLAEEVHASPWLAWGMLVPAAAELVMAARVPAGVRIVLILSALVLTGVAVMAWSGFRYLFTSLGVEVRTLSFHLYSVPAAQIKDYAVARWNPLGGYGIRGVGKRRAFVWGNRGVRIHTTDAEIFLGHGDPERIIHDLDAIKQFAH